MELKIKEVDIRKLSRYEDDRGSLLKIMMRQHLGETKQTFGEIYMTSAVPGAVKGNHYHQQTTEWFLVLRGQVNLGLVDIKNGNKDLIYLVAAAPTVVRVPPQIAHALKNVGAGEAEILAYADVPYDSRQPDAVGFEVFSLFR